METVAAFIGYAGAAMIALAYLANQQGRLPSENWRFPAINLAGSLAVLVSLWADPNLPSVVIEFFWAGISIYGLAKALRRR